MTDRSFLKTKPSFDDRGGRRRLVVWTWSGGNGTYTLTLPSAVTDAYRKIRIITDGTFTVNTFKIQVTAPSLQTINGAAFVEVNTSYSGILVWSDGANWRVIQSIS